MFSRKMVMIAGVIVLIAVNIIILAVNSRPGVSETGARSVARSVASPFQEAFSVSIHALSDIWENYFYLVTVARENEFLKKELGEAVEKNNRCSEIELSNARLRNFLKFQQNTESSVLAAEIIGKDPSPWFKTIIINKGTSSGVIKGAPVVVPEGIVGQVIDVSRNNAKVLLITDRNSAVDALVQRTRARGVVKGESTDLCVFAYALRKHDIKEDDIVVSSGLDGVYPKGLRIGGVSGVVKKSSGMFQDVTVIPYVDFEKLEEVMVLLAFSENSDESR